MYLYGCGCDYDMCEVHRSAFVAVSVVAHAFISFVCGMCGVCQSAHGLCRWISHASSHYCTVFDVLCVRSTDVLLCSAYDGGPLIHLMHHFICCGMCEVHRSAPGRCRWVSHASYCFVVVCVRFTDRLVHCT